jgi:hypothetical protein
MEQVSSNEDSFYFFFSLSLPLSILPTASIFYNSRLLNCALSLVVGFNAYDLSANTPEAATRHGIAVPNAQAPLLGQFLEQRQVLEISSAYSETACELFLTCRGTADCSDMSVDTFRALSEMYHNKDGGLFALAHFLVWWDFNVHQHVWITVEEFGMYVVDLAWRANGGDLSRARSEESMASVVKSLREASRALLQCS